MDAWVKQVAFVGTSAFRSFAPSSRFVIAATPRTGSSLLADLLDHHPMVRCEGEVLGSRPVLPLQVVFGRAVRARLTHARSYGFKLMFTAEQWDNIRFGEGHEMLRNLHDAGFRLIVVRRRNLLAQAISLLLAHRFGFHATHDDQQTWQRIALDPELVLARIVDLDLYDYWLTLSAGELTAMEVTYEDHLEDPAEHQHTVDSVARALEIPTAPVSTRLIRQADARISDRVSNLDSIMSLLRHTKYSELARSEI